MVRGDAHFSAPLVIDGTLWMDGKLPPNTTAPQGWMYRASVGTDVINHGNSVVLAHDDRPRVDVSNADLFLTQSGYAP